jgi:hypothetical protein
VYGEGNVYDYGFRIYNPRLGKFLSVDPLTKSFAWYTPYQFSGNKPIWAIDIDGLEEQVTTEFGYLITTTYAIVTEGPGKVCYAEEIIALQESINTALNNNPGVNVKFKEIDNPVLKEKIAANFIGPLPESGSLEEEIVNVPVQFCVYIVDGGDLESAMRIVYQKGFDGGAVIMEGDVKSFEPNSPGKHVGNNKIFLNPIYFNKNNENYMGWDNQNINGSINTILHEGPGHDMGLDHPVGIYPDEGLMSDTGGPIITPIPSDIDTIIKTVPKLQQ